MRRLWPREMQGFSVRPNGSGPEFQVSRYASISEWLGAKDSRQGTHSLSNGMVSKCLRKRFPIFVLTKIGILLMLLTVWDVLLLTPPIHAFPLMPKSSCLSRRDCFSISISISSGPRYSVQPPMRGSTRNFSSLKIGAVQRVCSPAVHFRESFTDDRGGDGKGK